MQNDRTPREEISWWQRFLRRFNASPITGPAKTRDDLYSPNAPHTCGASGKPTPEEDLAIARRAFAEGDLPHAAVHVAGLLFADPQDGEGFKLLDRLIEASPDPLSLMPLRADNWIGNVALRSAILAKIGQYQEAMSLMRQVVRIKEGEKYWHWGVDWLGRDGVAATITPLDGVIVLASVVGKFAGDTVPERTRKILLPAVTASAKLYEAFPENGMVLTQHALLTRKTGRLDEALALSERAWAMDPSYGSAIAVAIARKLNGDVDGAVTGYESTLRFLTETGSRAGRLRDAATTLGMASRFEEALAWNQKALAEDPNEPTAAAYMPYLHWRTGRGELNVVLRQLRDGLPTSIRCLLLGLEPYVDYLPEPEEATINVLAKILAEPAAKKQRSENKPFNVRVGVSSMEAPSSRLAAAMALCGGKLTVDVAQIQQPDPRIPQMKVDYLLWRYEGTEPYPALPAPPAKVVEMIAGIATDFFNLGTWAARAETVAGSLGTGAVEQILSAMVHPCPPPTDAQDWVWVSYFQTAAALVLACIDGGWENSLRRKALLSLLYGPDDWTTVAGIVALTHVASTLQSAAVTNEILNHLFARTKSIPRPGYCCYEYTLICAMQRLSRNDGERKVFSEWRQELEDDR